MKKMLFLLLTFLPSFLFGFRGELYIQFLNSSTARFDLNLTTEEYSWHYANNEVIRDAKSFSFSSDSCFTFGFDAPKRIDDGDTAISWGLINFAITTTSGLYISFLLDLRDESWVDDTFILIDYSTNKFYLSKGQGLSSSHIELLHNHTYNIWEFWNISTPNQENFRIPVKLVNEIENTSIHFGYLSANNKQIGTDNYEDIKINEGQVTHGSLDTNYSGRKYSFKWTHRDVESVNSVYSNTTTFNSSNAVSTNRQVTRIFKQVYPLTIKNNVGEIGTSSYGTILFKDPVTTNSLSSVSVSGNGYINNEAYENLSETINNQANQKYSVKAVSPITYNGKNYYWYKGDFNPTSNTDLTITGTISLNAYYKGINLSSSTSGFSSSSQRKLVRTEDGYLHKVYESMGYVWYERSTDNGVTWTFANDGKPLGLNSGKSPAIDYRGNAVGIVWQASDLGAVQLKIAYFGGTFIYSGYPKIVFWDPWQSYDNSLNPVIAWDADGRAIVAWENKSNDIYPIGIVVKYGPLSTLSYLNSDTWDGSSAYTIPTTDLQSINPTIAVNKYSTAPVYSPVYYIAWQQVNTSSNTILLCPMTIYASNNIIFSSTDTVSSGSGYSNNTNPSIIQLGDGVRISWKGNNSTMNAAAVLKDPDYYRFWNFDAGNGISSSSITSTTDGNYAVGWTLQSATSNRFVINSDFDNIRTFKTTANVNLAGNLQVSNGSAFTDMYAMSLNTQTSPYSFQISKKVSDIGIGKTNGEDLTYKGRGAVIYKGNAEVYFSLNDISSDGEAIDFVEAEDTLKITESSVLNNYLETKPFNVNSSSELVYGINYGMVDSSALAALLNGNSFISFKVEMVDVKTSAVLSELEDIEYSKINLAVTGEKAVKVNLSEIGSREIKLRVTLNDNIDAIYALVDKISTSENISKANIQEVQYTGVTVIKDYGLMQNYPNPFNPTTTITYQLPKDGMVTLKIYDAIGTEVTTLVHEYKSTGKYNVNFNASGLASGVYFYRLQANDFTLSKKLILMK